MKTILLFSRKGCRKPKQVGLATANGSAHCIRDFRNLIKSEGGKFFIVDAEDVTKAREIIATQQPSQTFDDGKTMCVGDKAVLAIAGSAKALSEWDRNLEKQGRVYNRQSKAL